MSVARADHCRADEPVRWSQSSDLGAPLVFSGQAAFPLTNIRYQRPRRPFAARSLGRQCCRAAMRSSRALDAVPRHRARACGLPRYAERRGRPRNRQPTRPSRPVAPLHAPSATTSWLPRLAVKQPRGEGPAHVAKGSAPPQGMRRGTRRVRPSVTLHRVQFEATADLTRVTGS